MKFMQRPRRQLLFLLDIGTVLSLAAATISPGNKVKQNKQLKVKSGPQEENVIDRNLVEEEPMAKDILIENAGYHKETSLRHFNGTVLGYVTAWNSHGYDVAKVFAKKFDIISPVWFQIVKQNDEYQLVGTHDIDAGWLKEVRRKSGVGGKTELAKCKNYLTNHIWEETF